MVCQTERAYVLKVSLEEIKPLIWRRVIVPDHVTLDRLHDIIQIIMGWKDYHLHQFMMNDKIYASNDVDVKDVEEESVRLCQLLKKKGDVLQYEYDFGDSWLHAILLEDIKEIPENYQLTITCLDGKKACPPEDIGGPSGFEHFCQVMKNPNDPEYEENLEWFGTKFKPNSLDLDAINQELSKYLRWSRPRKLSSLMAISTQT